MDYRLQIIQSPALGRMCGLPAKRDKRLLGPPLIIQLRPHIDNEEIQPEYLEDIHLYYCFLSLRLADDNHTPASARDSPLVHSQEFVGTPISSLSLLMNHSGKQGLYFCFPDVGIRSPGNYRLFCKVFKITESVDSPIIGTCVTNVIRILTNPFEIYSPNAYPGSLPPTRLTRHLVMQGAQIHISNAKRRN
ncbi:velvet factor [Gorgonomyces haynaldii]|nr:velvet factor [Gorgonomyces haynaldii]